MQPGSLLPVFSGVSLQYFVMQNFSLTVRVYIEDTDAGGIVYYANYLRYMERARTEWLRSCGIELDELQAEYGCLFVVKKLQAEYRAPARFNDQLTAGANMLTLKPASLMVEQPVMRGSELLFSATVQLACVNTDTLTPVAIPLIVREAITR